MQEQTERYLETACGRTRLQARYDWDAVVMDSGVTLYEEGQRVNEYKRPPRTPKAAIRNDCAISNTKGQSAVTTRHIVLSFRAEMAGLLYCRTHET